MIALTAPDADLVTAYHDAHLQQIRLALGGQTGHTSSAEETYRQIRDVLADPRAPQRIAVREVLLRPILRWAGQVETQATALFAAVPEAARDQLAAPLARLETALKHGDFTQANLAVASVVGAVPSAQLARGSAATRPAYALRDLFGHPAVWAWNRLIRNVSTTGTLPPAGQTPPGSAARLAAQGNAAHADAPTSARPAAGHRRGTPTQPRRHPRIH